MSNEDRANAYVMGALSPGERDEIARERLYNSALDEHIRLAEQLFAGLQPDQPQLAGAPKATGWSRIASAIALEEAALAAKEVQECSDGDWQVHGPGIEFKPLWSENALLIRCNPGACEDAHDQPSDMDEHILIMAGDLVIGGRRFGTGDYIRVPAGSMHQPMHTHNGCLLFTEYRHPD